MSNNKLFSAPGEDYVDHVKNCLQVFEKIFPRFKNTLKRIFGLKVSKIEYVLKEMVKYHDLGKLTEKWQNNFQNQPPPHAFIGGAYIFKKFGNNTNSHFKDLVNSAAFAIIIHHTDKGLLGDNIEKPDVMAINNGIVDFDNDKIKFVNFNNTLDIKLDDLRNIVRELRIWSRKGSVIDQHKKRLQVALVHHILKICDIVAASSRSSISTTQVVKEICNYYKSFQ